jgi:hypothetical protein
MPYSGLLSIRPPAIMNVTPTIGNPNIKEGLPIINLPITYPGRGG